MDIYDKNINVKNYIKFKNLLEWFVKQLNINNGVEDGNRTSGQGYREGSSIRERYKEWRDFGTFTLDCNIQSGFQGDKSGANYINRTGTGINVRPLFDKKTKIVTALFIDLYNTSNEIFEGSETTSNEQYDVKSLGLFDGKEPNDLINELFDNYAKIIEIYDSRHGEKNYGTNKIYYGAPGCGKSRYVSDTIKKYGVRSENVIRVTFHPEYANCDFIGQILPTVEAIEPEHGEIKEIVKYIFNPGPFTLALKTAYNTHEMVYLIIEEINRGNAAAIFGDMFQLLDRVNDPESPDYCVSEYPVCNPNMQKWLINEVEDTAIKATLKNGIFIPSNLAIIATMNSSDQNVFTLDTAFKRRWSFEQISNNIEKDTAHKYKGWYVPGTNVTWETFLIKLNDKILENKIHNQTNEDKRLGKYFVKKECLTENIESIADVQSKGSEFAYKVLEYIWNDVCKIGRDEWFDDKKYRTLEDLIEAFLNPAEEDNPLSIFQNITF